MTARRNSKIPIGFVLSLCTAFFLTASAAFAGTSQVIVTKTNDTGGTILAGNTFHYNIASQCNGPNGCAGLAVDDDVPAGLTIVSAIDLSNNSSCTIVGQHVHCPLNGVGSSNSTDTVQITVTVPGNTETGTNFANCATASSDSPGFDFCTGVDTPKNGCPGPSTLTGCDGDGFTVTECPVDLTITKACQTFCPPLVGVVRETSVCEPTDIVDPIPAGSDFTYNITVTNNGTGTAHNVILDDALPAGITFDDVSPNPCASGDISPDNNCNLGDIAAAGSVSFTIHVTANDSGTITNTASVSSDENCDKNPNDNSASCGVTVETDNMPTALEADRESSSTDTTCIGSAPISTSSDVNRVIEPGESARIDPTWHNNLSNADADTTGTADTPTSVPGGTLTIEDCSADYGAIPGNSDSDCNSATGDCYQMIATENVAGVRPHSSDHPRHWDTTFKETLSSGETHTFKLHIGDTFPDVPRSNPFYRFIETILHNRITVGCGDGNFFCPSDPVIRAQIAAFVARSLAGNDTLVPTSGTGWNCSTGPSLFTDVTTSNGFCKHINYLKEQKIVNGCTGTTFCPDLAANRGAVAVVIARAAEWKLGNTADPDGSIPLFGNDTTGARAYNCDSTDHTNTVTAATITAGTPPFPDVPTSGDVCKSVGLLYALHVVDGSDPAHFFPASNIQRDQAAKILTHEFVNLPLYGP